MGNWLHQVLCDVFRTSILCYIVLWWAIGANNIEMAPVFQCGWFVFGTVSQVLIIHMIRTGKKPFLQSMPSRSLFFSTLVVAIVALIIGFTRLSVALDMMPLPVSFIPWLLILLIGYGISAQMIKKVYVKFYKEWL